MKEKIKVLNHGFIRLVDYMGSDQSIEKAARQSYDENPELSTRGEKDTRRLLRYLMRNRHTSPFEMAEVVFQVKAPIFVFRQWHRHRTASINEISGRYAQLPDEYYLPKNYLKQSSDNKQGSSSSIHPEAGSLHLGTVAYIEGGFNGYKYMNEAGVSKEQARMHLPLSTFSTMTWKCNLHNLFHFLKLRLDSHAQYEIRVYAREIANIVMELFPISYEAFEDYILSSTTFSNQELMSIIMSGIDFDKCIDRFIETGATEREIKEFTEKLKGK